jgi:hypothetical protein
VRAWLAERYARSTANAHLSALRRVLAECRRLGLLDQAAYARVASIASLPRARSRQATLKRPGATGQAATRGV